MTTASRASLPLAAGLLLLAGCAPPPDIVVLRLDDNAHIGRAIVNKPDATVELTERNLAAATVRQPNQPPLNTITLWGDDAVIATFSGAIAGQPPTPTAWTVYFNFDSTAVIPQSEAPLAEAIKAGQLSLFADLSIVGHADATGDPDLNRILSLRRAATIRDAFVHAGVPADGIDILAVGADLPLVPAPEGVPTINNRAVEITVR